MAPIPELAGRRAAPPIDLSLCHGLFGRKEKRKPKDFNFANTFLRKTPLAIFCPALRDTLPKREGIFRIFAIELFAGSLLYCNCVQLLGIAFFNSRLGQQEAILVEHNRGGYLSFEKKVNLFSKERYKLPCKTHRKNSFYMRASLQMLKTNRCYLSNLS